MHGAYTHTHTHTDSKQNLRCQGANGSIFDIPKQVFHSY